MRPQANLETTASTARTIDDETLPVEHKAATEQEHLEQQRLLRLQELNKQQLLNRRSQMGKIPRHEQDEDLWRHAMPGRDPVTEERGPSV